jgi:hypothetical protein
MVYGNINNIANGMIFYRRISTFVNATSGSKYYRRVTMHTRFSVWEDENISWYHPQKSMNYRCFFRVIKGGTPNKWMGDINHKRYKTVKHFPKQHFVWIEQMPKWSVFFEFALPH